ncbi:MAG: DNA methyltransferase [Promethearchaeota archaeon]
MTKYFVYVSGENVDVGQAEVSSIVHLLGVKKIIWKNRIGFFDSSESPTSFILDRGALVKESGIVLVETSDSDTLETDLSDDVLRRIIESTETFAVRTISLAGQFKSSERYEIESRVGAYVKEKTNARVSLRNPQSRILVFLSDDRVWLCKSSASKLRSALQKREPGRKPFFHPSMMNSTLARVMCNLAGVMPGEIVLDPFCGGGGILCEALLMGARTVGIDLNWRLLIGGVKNLSAIGGSFSFLQGDVRNIPVNMCDCIVTDPPYGRASSTRGAHAVHLVQSLLDNVDSMVRRRKNSLCICGSSEMNIQGLVKERGFQIDQVLHVRVHSGLVREVLTVGF